MVLVSQENPQNLIHDAISKAASILIEELQSPEVETETKPLAFLTTLNPNDINLFPTVWSVFNSLQEVGQTKHVFSKYNLIKSQRQPPNLKKL